MSNGAEPAGSALSCAQKIPRRISSRDWVLLLFFCAAGSVACDIQNGFTVNLQGSGTVKFHSDLPAGQNADHIFVLDMLTLENAGESHQRPQPSAAVEHHHRKLAFFIGAILAGGGHHTAAVESAQHGGGDPNLVECMDLSVHRDGGVGGLVVE